MTKMVQTWGKNMANMGINFGKHGEIWWFSSKIFKTLAIDGELHPTYGTVEIGI